MAVIQFLLENPVESDLRDNENEVSIRQGCECASRILLIRYGSRLVGRIESNELESWKEAVNHGF